MAPYILWKAQTFLPHRKIMIVRRNKKLQPKRVPRKEFRPIRNMRCASWATRTGESTAQLLLQFRNDLRCKNESVGAGIFARPKIKKEKENSRWGRILVFPVCVCVCRYFARVRAKNETQTTHNTQHTTNNNLTARVWVWADSAGRPAGAGRPSLSQSQFKSQLLLPPKLSLAV